MPAPRDRVLEELVARCPSGFRLDRPPAGLGDLSTEDLDAGVSALTAEGITRLTVHTNKLIPGRQYSVIALTNPTAYPIRETISVAGQEFPRMIPGDVAGAEDLNGYVELIAIIEERAEKRLNSIAENLTHRYWVNTAGLFGVFLAAFALVLRSSEPIVVADRSVKELFLLKAAEVGPLAITLLGFTLITAVFIRRR